MKKNKLFERGMSLFLSFAMILGMIPAMTIETRAASNYSYIATWEPTYEELKDTDYFGNGPAGYKTVTRSNVFETESGQWAIDAFNRMREEGVYFGTRKQLNDDPTKPLHDGLVLPLTVNDVLGLMLIYYFPGMDENRLRIYKGADSRKDTFEKAKTYALQVFESKEQQDIIRPLEGGEYPDRLVMIQLICLVLEQLYGARRDEFSNTELGKDSSGNEFKTKISEKTNPASTFVDKEEIDAKYKNSEIMRLLNMALAYTKGDV